MGVPVGHEVGLGEQLHDVVQDVVALGLRGQEERLHKAVLGAGLQLNNRLQRQDS